MTKVYWKPAEVDLVMGAAYEIFKNNHTDKSWRQCIVEGQRILPEDRQRPEGSIKTTPKKTLDEYMEIGKKINDAMVAAHEAELAEERRLAAEEQARIAEEERARFEEENSVGGRITKMIDTVVLDFEHTLEKKLTESVNKIFARIERQIAHKIARMNPHAKIPRVLIIGLLGRHEENIRKDFDPYLDIAFLDANQIGQIKDKIAHRDYVVINTAFVNHSVTEKVRGHKGMMLADGNNAVADRLLEIITMKEKQG